MTGKLIRQGDLLFRPIQEIPSWNTQKVDGDIVALGEATGHKHKCKGGQVQLFAELENPNQINFIDVKQDTTLTHEEHKPVNLSKGLYAVVHEREYNPFTIESERIRQVAD